MTFGRRLATLHLAGAPARGHDGTAPMIDEPAPSWPEWSASQRIAPYARMAGIDLDDVCARITSLAAARRNHPAHLHRDLWSGDVLWGADGQVWHVPGAYQEIAQLVDGWKARVPLHQLFPLLTHAVVFGGGYRSEVLAAARSVLQG